MECLRHNNVKRRAFTMIEVSVALIILGVIAATVLVVINKAIDTVVVWQTKMEAFEIVRDNMEQILAKSSVSDMLEYGTSPTNPDITYETKIESFYEPITNKMWVRAVCSAQFPDPNGEPAKIELVQWLTGLSEKQIQQILEQKRKMAEYQMDFNSVNDMNYPQMENNTNQDMQNNENYDDTEVQTPLRRQSGSTNEY